MRGERGERRGLKRDEGGKEVFFGSFFLLFRITRFQTQQKYQFVIRKAKGKRL